MNVNLINISNVRKLNRRLIEMMLENLTDKDMNHNKNSSMAHPITTVIKRLSDDGHTLAIFKNLHRINEAMQGKADLDVLLQSGDQASVEYIEKVGWLAVQNPSLADKDIFHYYYFDISQNKIYHLHIHLTILTGHSWLKEWQISSELNSNSITSYTVAGTTLPTLDTNFLKLIHQFRIIIKIKA